MQKLSSILARADRTQLEKLAGEDAVKLLRSFTGPVTEPALAALIVNKLGVQDALFSNDIRNLAFDYLNEDEARSICELVLGDDTGTPAHTLRSANFQRNDTYMGRLLAHFGEGHEVLSKNPKEKSNFLIPTKTLTEQQREVFSVLREHLSSREKDILLQMPFACGKAFIAAHAVVDLLRTSRDGDSILWLAEAEPLCDDVFETLGKLWIDVGTKDVMFCRAYGQFSMASFANLTNSVIVADQRCFANSIELDQLRLMAPSMRAVVVGDALSAIEGELADALSALRQAGAGNLLGITSAPASFMRARGIDGKVKERFGSIVSSSDDTISFARWQAPGFDSQLELSVRQSRYEGPIESTVGRPSEASVAQLAANFSRNRILIEIIQSEVDEGRGVAFFAATENQAQNFVGILSANGVKAILLSANMSAERKERQRVKFTAQPEATVICVYDVAVSGEELGKVHTAVMAAPTCSFSKVARFVGRFLTGGEDRSPMRLIFIDDGFHLFTLSADYIKSWDKLESDGEF